ncbi:hypothetical protein [Dysgonomonas massiliensis]|uniref:hypothetical protein n=1 Tax=Dysgonomonas massiliensis TaxID=2040292 RepID=UPI000C763403|nr:hypothetical protein [Dysgonomonas massiliensis]
MARFIGNMVVDHVNKNGLIDKTIKYFTDAGFKLIRQTENLLIFRRGLFCLSSWIFNPLAWKSKVKVKIKEDSVVVDYVVDEPKQILTKRELELWQFFIGNYADSLFVDTDYNKINNKAVRGIRLHSIKLGFVLLLVGLVGGVIGVYAAIKLDFSFLIPFSVVVPIVLALKVYIRKYS